jgi:hypothetical protein
MSDLRGNDLLVFNRLVELSSGDRADVQFQDLIKGYPDGGLSSGEVGRALQRLRTTHYVCTLQTYGIGGKGVELLEQRVAEAEPQVELEGSA